MLVRPSAPQSEMVEEMGMRSGCGLVPGTWLRSPPRAGGLFVPWVVKNQLFLFSNWRQVMLRKCRCRNHLCQQGTGIQVRRGGRG